MEFCPKVEKGLKLLCNANIISDDIYIKLIDATFKVLNDEQHADISNLGTSKADIIKLVFSSLLSLFVEATRNDLDNEVVSLYLSQNYNFTKPRLDKLINKYKLNKAKLQATLSSIGSHPPQIVDCTWSLDYCIKTNNLEHADALQYLIQFHSEVCDPESEKKIEKFKFLCSVEELQDLVSKLKDALKHVERFSNMTL